MTTSNGPGRTVWLASYPKSGNTWMRAIVTALGSHPHLFGVNHLGSGSQPMSVGAALQVFGIDPRWLSRPEIDAMRDLLVRRWGDAPGTDTERGLPLLRKTHESYRAGPVNSEPFPLAATRAAILIVRDPRDVACSYAPFFGVTLAEAVDAIGRPSTSLRASPANATTAQPWGSWSSHAHSWLAGDVPFPVHLVRYEDLMADAVGVLHPVFHAVGLPCTEDELTEAVERTRFDRLQASEQDNGFRETSRKTRAFFRKGQAGGWRNELTDEQVLALEADHDEWMSRLGYELSTSEEQRAGMRDVRASLRRQRSTPWWHLPSQLEIEVTLGEVPDHLTGAASVRPWIKVTATEALVTFSSGSAVYVREGHEAVVQWQPDPNSPDDDPSWIVQGWVVTLAMLQRGQLSLHAATVSIGDQTVAIAGNRGAGKSTASMGLRARGHRLLVDDVTLLDLRPEGAWTTAYSRNVHLLPDSAAAVGLNFDALRPLSGGRVKVGFRAEEPPDEPQRIDRIVVLAPSQQAKAVTLQTARGIERFRALSAHTRRDGIAPIVLGQDRYFELLARLADSTEVQVLTRPRDDWTLDEVLDVIEQG